MHEFKGTSGDFDRRIRRKIMWGISLLIVLTVSLWASWFKALPRWLEVSASAIVALFLAVELLSYRKAKAIAETFSIQLLDDALSFSYEGGSGRLPYGDLRISKVKRRNGEIVEIRLRTTFRQTIKLRDLEDMQELYEQLSARVSTRA